MLSLLTAMFGPIFAKEMVEMARRKRHYFTRVFYGLVLLFALFMVYLEFRSRLARGDSNSIRAMSQMATVLFQAVSMIQYGAVYLFVPLFLCGVIASEREEKTLELLFTTHLKDRDIVFGKLSSRVVVLLLLLFGGLPVLSLIMLFGGIEPLGVLKMTSCTCLSVLFVGAHAIYFSATTRSPVGALVRTYWWLAIWVLAIPAGLITIMEGARISPTDPIGRVVAVFLFLTNPLGPFIVTMSGFLNAQLSTLLGGYYFLAGFALPALWSVFLIWRTVRCIRQEPTRVGAWLGRLPLIRTWLARRRQKAARDAVPRRRRVERIWSILPVRNPLWLRARLAPVFDREGYIGRIQRLSWFVAIFFITLVGIIDFRDLRDDEAAMLFCGIGWGAVLALIAIFSGTAFVGDRRRGFLDLVLVTPLSPREFVDGTLLAVWEHVRRLFWLPLILAFFFAFIGRPIMLGALISVFTAVLGCVLLAIHGLACSLSARTFAGALIATFAFPLVMNIGLPFLIPIFERDHALVLWTLAAVAAPVSWLWVRRRLNPASVSAFLMAVHLAICCLFTFWTWDSRRFQFPVAGMCPMYLIINVLERSSDRWLDRVLSWRTFYPCYWTAMILNIFWARSWLIRNFERLAGNEAKRGSEGRNWWILRKQRPKKLSPLVESRASGEVSRTLST